MGLDMFARAVKFIDGHDEPQADANLNMEGAHVADYNANRFTDELRAEHSVSLAACGTYSGHTTMNEIVEYEGKFYTNVPNHKGNHLPDCVQCVLRDHQCTTKVPCIAHHFLIEVEPMDARPAPQAMAPVPPEAPSKPAPAQPTAKQLAGRLLDLSQAENTTALLRKLLRQRAESTDYRLGLTLDSNNNTRKLVLRNLKTNTTTELETAFLRQAFEVHAEALLTTLLELHTQQVTAMKAELSDSLLDTAVEYRK